MRFSYTHQEAIWKVAQERARIFFSAATLPGYPFQEVPSFQDWNKLRNHTDVYDILCLFYSGLQ